MSDESVNQSLDKYPANDYTIKSQLVSQVLDRLIDISPIYVRERLVNFLYDNITKGQYKQLLIYIDHNPVFLVPTIWRTLKVSRQHVYSLIKDLKRLDLVKRTNYKIEPPDPRVSGMRPRIYIVNGIKLSGAMDPRIDDAREKYHRTFERYSDFGSNGVLKQTLISQLVNHLIDQSISEGRYGTYAYDPDFLKERIKEDPRAKEMGPQDIYRLAKQIHNKLSYHDSGSR